jgi:hypothetical protein
MKKQDLEKGWILETRNGGMYVNAGVQWLGRDGWLSPDNFNDDLYHIRSVELSIYEFDIIKVYKLNPFLHQGFNFASNNKTHLELLWEREEYEEISFQEAVGLMVKFKKVYIDLCEDGNKYPVDLDEDSINTVFRVGVDDRFQYYKLSDIYDLDFYKDIN